MTGPDHYPEAERLLSQSPELVAEAQVHATLAVAAATAGLAGHTAEGWFGRDAAETTAWQEAFDG